MLRADLERVRERIAMGWTQGTLARDADGRCIEPFAEKATCWCLVGAADVEHVSHYDLRRALAVSSLSKWNDHFSRTPAEVLARIDKAIASCAEGAK